MTTTKNSLLFFFALLAIFSTIPSLFADDDVQEMRQAYDYWHDKFSQAKEPSQKVTLLFEMIQEAVKEKEREDVVIYLLLANTGPRLVMGEKENNGGQGFKKCLRAVLKEGDFSTLDDRMRLSAIQVMTSLYQIEGDEVDKSFLFELRELIERGEQWRWGHEEIKKSFQSKKEDIDQILGPKIYYQIRGRIIIRQPIVGTKEVVFKVRWELVQLLSHYDESLDRIAVNKEVLEEKEGETFILKKEAAEEIKGDYGTKMGIYRIFEEGSGKRKMISNIDEAREFFNNFLAQKVDHKIAQNPAVQLIASSNWERVIPEFLEGFCFVSIPAGTFMMGSPEGEFNRESNELRHQVTLTHPIYVMRTEVTQKQWKGVMRKNPSYFKGDDLPVENISWWSAVFFANRLSESQGLMPAYDLSSVTFKEGTSAEEGTLEAISGEIKMNAPDGNIYKAQGYRLPTEAEWEYAARAGTKTAFHFGNTITPDQANYNGDYLYNQAEEKGIYREKTVPVESLGHANAWGLFDVHGNVSEWCHDSYEKNYPESTVTDPICLSRSSDRVIRGGSWNSNAQNLRSAYRSHWASGHHSSFVGFRLVRTK